MAHEATPVGPRTTAGLDHAAGTPMHPLALAVMTRHLAVKGIYAARHGHDARRTRGRCTLWGVPG